MNAQARYISGKLVRELVRFSEIRALMVMTLSARPAHADDDPLRFAMKSQASLLGIMPGTSQASGPAHAVHGVKLVSLGENAEHRGMMILFSSDSGLPVALIEAGQLTAIRTAAVSAVVTEKLASREGIERIAVIGSGTQALAHIEAFSDLFPDAHFNVFARGKKSFDGLAANLPMLLQEKVSFCDSPQNAARNTQVICTVTRSREPLLDINDVPDQCHINAIGSCSPNARELSSRLVASCERFVDSLPAAEREAGDLLRPIAEGLFTRTDIGIEVGELIRSSYQRKFRSRTLFKSLGLPCEDIAFAKYLLDKATTLGQGLCLDLT